jgi:hypothetical protein
VGVDFQNYIRSSKMEITVTSQAIWGEIPKIKSEQQKISVFENAEIFYFTQHKISLSTSKITSADSKWK